MISHFHFLRKDHCLDELFGFDSASGKYEKPVISFDFCDNNAIITFST